MANFVITNGSTSGGGTQQPTAAAYTGALIGITAVSTAPTRIKLYDLLIGTNGTPADNFVEWDISRITAASTATVLAATALDNADSASNETVTVNSSQFGTITSGSNCFYIGVNQRASYRWVAAPGGELVAPATSSNGFQLRQRSGSYTGTATGTLEFEEQ